LRSGAPQTSQRASGADRGATRENVDASAQFLLPVPFLWWAGIFSTRGAKEQWVCGGDGHPSPQTIRRRERSNLAQDQPQVRHGGVQSDEPQVIQRPGSAPLAASLSLSHTMPSGLRTAARLKCWNSDCVTTIDSKGQLVASPRHSQSARSTTEDCRRLNRIWSSKSPTGSHPSRNGLSGLRKFRRL